MTLSNKQSFFQKIVPLLIIGGLFFIFGFVSWVNAILIPYFKIACELTHTQAYLVAMAFYIAYLVVSIPASKMLNAIGFKKGMMYGLWFMALGTLLFVPAAYTRTYGVFLAGLFCIGTGLSILQTAVNPYIVIIGPIASAAKRMSIMGVCNKVAGIIAPLLFAAVIFKASDSQMFADLENGNILGDARTAMLDELIRRVITPYLCLSAFLFLFGIFIKKSSLPEIDTEEENADEGDETSHRTSILQYPYLILGAIAIFFHVGSQIIAIDTIIGYAGTMGMDLNEAKAFPSYTMTFTLIGYLVGIICIPRLISQTRMLQIATVTGLVLSFGVILFTQEIMLLGHQANLSILFLIMLGLPNALIYAGIWPLAIHNLGKYTNLGSSLLVMGLCGNAFLPVIYGAIADKTGEHNAYWVLVPCFIYLIFYSFVGHKINHWGKTAQPTSLKENL